MLQFLQKEILIRFLVSYNKNQLSKTFTKQTLPSQQPYKHPNKRIFQSMDQHARSTGSILHSPIKTWINWIYRWIKRNKAIGPNDTEELDRVRRIYRINDLISIMERITPYTELKEVKSSQIGDKFSGTKYKKHCGEQEKSNNKRGKIRALKNLSCYVNPVICMR